MEKIELIGTIRSKKAAVKGDGLIGTLTIDFLIRGKVIEQSMLIEICRGRQ